MRHRQVGRPTVTRHKWLCDGWFYKQAGQACGPVPAGRLKVLLAVGLLRPRQAVWQRSGEGLFFVHAAAAASGAGRREAPPDAGRRTERGVTLIAPYGEEIEVGG
jgi:hypothetical protein